MTSAVEFLGGRVVLHQGCALEIMPTLEAVDVTCCDPPYEAHMHEAKRGKKIYGARERIRTDGHANPPPVDFASIDGMREPATREICRLTKRWALIFCTPEGVAPWRDEIEAAGARYKRACFWFKPDGAPQFNGQGPAMAVEAFVAAWCGEGHASWNGGGRRNLFTHQTNNSTRDGRHPTEKPLGLMGELIELFSNSDDLVLDPFMGSGTTGVACIRNGRRFIGVEKDPKYFDIACERVAKAAQQGDLLRMIEPKAKQDSLFGGNIPSAKGEAA